MILRIAGCLGLFGGTVACGQATPAAPEGTGSGASTILVTAVIGEGGGELNVPASESGPLGGARVIFPHGAVTRSTQVTLSWWRQALVVRSGTPSGLVLELEVAGVKRFDAPVQLELRDNDMGLLGMPIPYLLDVENHLHVAQLKSYSLVTRRFVISTFVPGRYTWVRS